MTEQQRLVLGIATGLLLIVIVFSTLFFIKQLRRRSYFRRRWQELHRYLANKETWPLAIITADKLLGEALKKKRFKGKSVGERLVSAQRQLTDNDTIWFAHNLAKKLMMDESAIRLRQADVKKSLLGFLQAFKDLGVIE